MQRASAPGDRRSLLIVLTPSGEKTLKRAVPIHEDGIRRHFAVHILDTEAPAVEAALARIAAAARQHDSFGWLAVADLVLHPDVRAGKHRPTQIQVGAQPSQGTLRPLARISRIHP